MTAFILKPHMQRWYRAARSGGAFHPTVLPGPDGSLPLQQSEWVQGRGWYDGASYATISDYLTAASGTFSRGSDATYFDAGGVPQTAGSNVLRLDHDPVTGVPLGFRAEGQRTNILVRGSDLTQAWVLTRATAAKTASGPDAVANSASTLTATNFHGSAFQRLTSASAQRATSLYLKRRTGSGGVYLSQGDTPGPELVKNGGFDADADWTKGEGWTISGGKASIDGSNGSDSFLTQSLNTATGNLYRVSYTISDYVSGQVRLQFRGVITMSGEFHNANGTYTWYYNATTNNTFVAFPADAGTKLSVDNVSIKEVSQKEIPATINWARYTTGAATIADPQVLLRLASLGDEVDVALFQHEIGGFTSSPIQTDASTVTRLADALAYTLPGTPEGSIVIHARTPLGASGNQVLWQWDDGTEDNRLRLVRDSDGDLHFIVTVEENDEVDLDLRAVVNDTDFKVAASWKEGEFRASLNGGTAVSDTSYSGSLPTVTTMREGSSSDGEEWYGTIARMVRYDKAYSAEQIEEMAS